MKFGNIQRLGLFRSINAKTPNEKVFTVQELHSDYFRPDGTNVYIGFTQLCDRVKKDQSALLPGHLVPMQDLAALTPDGETAYVGINIEPNLPGANAVGQYDFLLKPENKPVYSALAAALHDLPQVKSGKLKPVVRFAGEMNGGNVHSGKPALFKDCLPRLKEAFAPKGIALSFCPAINSGVPSLDSILQYLPTDDSVFTYAACTLYVRPEENRESVMKLYADYVNHFGNTKKFFIDEIGGCDTDSTGNDQMLKKMIEAIPVPVEYATLFLSVGPTTHWGQDAKLAFLPDLQRVAADD